MIRTDRPAQSNEKRVEWFDDSLDQIKKLMARCANRLTLENLRLAERYVKGELCVGVCFKSKFITGEIKQYCALFNCNIGGLQGDWHEGDVVQQNADDPCVFASNVRSSALLHRFFEECAEINDQITVIVTDRDKQSVLVDIVEFIQTPKQVIPSTIRFESVDQVNRLLVHAPYFSWTSGFVLKGIIKNRERDLSISRVGPSVCNDQIIDKVVKHAPKILQNISEVSRNRQRDIGSIGYDDASTPRFQIVIGNDFIGIAGQEQIDARFEIIDVFFGPFNLSLDTGNTVNRHS
jgi:hypothetical protein